MKLVYSPCCQLPLRLTSQWSLMMAVVSSSTPFSSASPGTMMPVKVVVASDPGVLGTTKAEVAFRFFQSIL